MLLPKHEMGKFCHTQFLFLFAVFIAWYFLRLKKDSSKNKMMNRIVFATIRAGLTQIFFLTWCMQSLLGFLRESLFYLRKYHAINVTNRNKNECGRICPFSVLEATYCLNQQAFHAQLVPPLAWICYLSS